jgi:uncharacterized membrane protein YgcG
MILSLPNARSLPPSRGAWGGFSVVELVATIAVLGVFLTMAVMSVGRQPVSVKNVKLEADVAVLNQVVGAYVADGGDLRGVSSPQAVLDRLKRPRPQTEWQRHTGATSGKVVDVRLRARTSAAPAAPDMPRARWNAVTQRFEMTTGGGTAVTEFYLDESLTTRDFGTDTRSRPVVSYNTGNRGWIWASTTTPTLTYANPGDSTGPGVDMPFDPTEAAPSTTPSDGGGAGGSGGSGGGGSGGTGGGLPPATRLPTPNLSPGGGTFAYNAFPSTVSISRNGAPAGESRLQYRINGGGWTDVAADSASVTVASGSSIEVRNYSLDTTRYFDSNSAAGSYYRLISNVAGTHTGTWGNATGGSNLVTTIDNGPTTATFRHGNTKLDLGDGQYLDAGLENVLSFEKTPFSDVQPNTWFRLGNLVMLNGTTFYSSEAQGVTLSVNLNLTNPAHSGVVHVDLGLISTENSNDRLSSADIVELKNPSTDFVFTADGVQYRLELSWVTLDPGAGVAQGNQFLIFEGASARAELRGRFVSNH